MNRTIDKLLTLNYFRALVIFKFAPKKFYAGPRISFFITSYLIYKLFIEREVDVLRIFIKIAQPMVSAFLLIGCTHNVAPIKPLQDKAAITQIPEPTLWHNGSKGGVYGIGNGWSIEILRPEYVTITETVVVHESRPLITIPAEYEWVKDNNEGMNQEPLMTNELITLPAEYEAVTDTIIVEREKTEYYLTDAIYNSDETIKTARAVKQRIIPAVKREETRQVVKVPARTVERMVPLEKRKGYIRVVKIPARTMESPPLRNRTESRIVQKQPWRFIIKNPDKLVAHMFDDFEKLTAFTDSLK